MEKSKIQQKHYDFDASEII